MTINAPRLIATIALGATLSSPGCGPASGGGGGGGMTANLVDGVFTDAEFAEVKKLGPLPDLPANTTNKYADNAAAAAFGQRLYFEKSASGPLGIGDDGTN